MTTKKLDAIRSLGRSIGRTSPERRALLRAALRQAFDVQPASEGRPRLASAIHCLRMAEGSAAGVDPESALRYLAEASQVLAELELAIARALDLERFAKEA